MTNGDKNSFSAPLRPVFSYRLVVCIHFLIHWKPTSFALNIRQVLLRLQRIRLTSPVMHIMRAFHSPNLFIFVLPLAHNTVFRHAYQAWIQDIIISNQSLVGWLDSHTPSHTLRIYSYFRCVTSVRTTHRLDRYTMTVSIHILKEWPDLRRKSSHVHNRLHPSPALTHWHTAHMCSWFCSADLQSS